MNTLGVTLRQHLSLQLLAQPNAETLEALMHAVAGACKNISELSARGASTEVTDKLTNKNVQGETQTQLDILSNDLFIDMLRATQLVAGLVSEEVDEVLDLHSSGAHAPFLGSIFSILNTPPNGTISNADYLQKGHAQVAAGYALYGPSSMLVLTVGLGTHGYTLDRDSGEYLLTHPDIRMPESTSEFSINASNERFWEPPVQRYIVECKAGSAGERARDFNMRWAASMVADVHRILMRGGVYLYPQDNKTPLKAGRLRLLYEANPMAFIVEQAGGASSTGRQPLLDIAPNQIHQRIPVILGSKIEVNLVEQYHKEFDAGYQTSV
ncbi:Fructose-1,6-bisphosphatase class 1 2 [Nymphon striatum]|nr:Fructose-1,6-bisphosphatase class 1 2 [Nymphon striatum]